MARDDVISHVTMAIKHVLAYCKNRLLSIQKQITCPDGHWDEQFGNCQLTSDIRKLRWLCTGAFPRGLVRSLQLWQLKAERSKLRLVNRTSHESNVHDNLIVVTSSVT